jgi:drug/metabolite transporter (DMT)-like permease
VRPADAGETLSVVLAIVYSGVLAAAIANVIVFNGVRLLGPTRVITLQSFVPPMAVVMAFVFLGEPIRPAQVVGGLIIVLGVAMTRRVSGHPVAVRR